MISSDKPKIKLTLKSDWDYPPNVQEPQKHFAGRQIEINWLVSLITRKHRGSILISGCRGAGKTALVYKALANSENILSKDNKKKVGLIKAVLSIAHLPDEIASKEDPKQKNSISLLVLKSLITRLYLALEKERKKNLPPSFFRQPIEYLKQRSDKQKHFLPKELQQQYQDLYCKAAYSSVKISEETKNKTLEQEYKRIAFGTKLVFRITPVVLGALITQAVVFQYYLSITLRLGFSIIDYVLFAGAYLLYEHYSEKKSSKEKVAKVIYQQDVTLSSLQFDFEQLLKQLFSMGYRMVFVIDELDKLEKDTIVKVVEDFKNLFTLAPALFIFITDHTVTGQSKVLPADRGKDYTLFSNKIFISRPLFSDLELFLKDIFVEKPDSQVFDNFVNYICFECCSDYFDLNNVIDSMVQNIVLEKEIRQQITLTLTDEGLIKARCQKALGQVFELFKRKSLTEWQLNEQLLSSLYLVVEKAAVSGTGSNFTKPVEAKGWQEEAEIELCNYLCRLGAFKKSPSATQGGEEEKTILEHRYEYTGKCSEVKAQIDDLLNYELSYLDAFDSLQQKLLEIEKFTSEARGLPLINASELTEEENLSDLEALSGVDVSNIYLSSLETKDKLKQKPPVHFTEEEISQQIQRINEHISLLEQKFKDIVGNVIKELLPDYASGTFQNNANLINNTPQEIKNYVVANNIEHLVIYSPDYTKQVLITSDIDPAAIIDNKKELRNNSCAFNIIYLAADSKNYPETNWYKGFFRNIKTASSNMPSIITEIKRIEKWAGRTSGK